MIMKLWIARAKFGYITLHYSKPKEKNGGWNDVVAVLGDNYFPEVTFENSPQEVELKLVNEIVGVAESPLKTFPRENEFEVGASYRH